MSARSAATIKKPGRHSDGGNLYLYVSKSGSRSWVFIYATKGKQREMGLGPARDVPLIRARELAASARRHIVEGRDPLIERHKQTQTKTFGECADSYVEAMTPQWANAKHIWQWSNTLTVHAATLRPKAVGEVGTEDVLEVLRPIWTKTPETAARLRGRIEAVLDSAKAQGLREGENPARWRGHLEQLLPKRARLSRGHQKALPFAEVPAFMKRLRDNPAISARALEFTILTAARTGEAIGARWDEFNLDGRLWTVPAERMKMGRTHRVPLSDAALDLLTKLGHVRIGDFVFPSKAAAPLSNMAMLMLARGMESGITVHGFRSAFKDWASEKTDYPDEVSEMALAHIIKDSVERAYRRGDLFDKRQGLMQAWAGFCLQSSPRDVSNGRSSQ